MNENNEPIRKVQTYTQSTPQRLYTTEVIVLELVRGRGDEADPARPVFQYWTKGGKLLKEEDEWLDAQ